MEMILVVPGMLKVVPGVLQKKEININGVIVVLSSVQNVLKVKNNLGLNWAKLSSNWNWACCFALMIANCYQLLCITYHY